MDIYKIPSCWPTTFIYGIPIAEMLQKENLIDKKFKHANNVRTDNVLLDFVFQFCVIANLGRETAHAAILTFEHFGSKIKDLSKYDIQLVAMTCILICSKMFDVKPLPLSTLHQISAHVYNNQMVLKCERTLLNILDYDLFIRDNLIVDRVGLYLESVRYLLDPQDFSIFTDICFKLTDLIHEDMKIIKDNDFVLLCAAVIQASLVIATKRDGKMPITLKLALMTGKKEEDIIKQAKKIIKHCLGRNIFKKFTF